MSKYKDIIKQVNYIAFLAVVALLPFPQLWLRYACVFWFISWALEGRWLQHSTFNIQHSTFRSALPFLLFGLWYGWKAVSGIWSPDHEAWAWQMERYMTFALAIPIGIWGVNERYDWQQIGRILVVSCVIAVPFYLVVLSPLYYHREIIDYLRWEGDWNYGVHSWYSFFSDNISVLKHRLFLCSVELLGAVIALQVWRDKKWLLALCLPIMLSAIPLTGSRQSILTFAAILVVWLIYALPKVYRWRYGLGIIVFGAVISGTILKFHPRMSKFDIHAATEIREVSTDHDVRFNIWGCALQHPEDYLAYGLGAGQSTDYLMKTYQEKGFEYYYTKHYHAHNQYLEELMEIGIPGLVLFLLAWLSILFCTEGEGKRFAILFVTLFGLNMLTDCMFGKFDGIALWAVGMVYSCSILSKTRCTNARA